MWTAAFDGHVGALNVLIRAKADVNAADVVSLIFILNEIILCYTELISIYWAKYYYLLV